MEKQATINLERYIINALPNWIEREPALRQVLENQEDILPRFPTFEAFIDWVDEDMSAEWVNGEVVLMSPASTKHQLIVGFIYHILDLFVQDKKLGVVLSAPYKMKLNKYGPEPDVLFVAKRNLERVLETYLNGPADLVVEVVSPESIGRDRGDKFIAYEAAGILEYWLIDPLREQAEFYLLGDDARYHVVGLGDNGRFHSHIIPNFWINPDWFWTSPLPSPLSVLRQLNVI